VLFCTSERCARHSFFFGSKVYLVDINSCEMIDESILSS
jgi:hypothetical protein